MTSKCRAPGHNNTKGVLSKQRPTRLTPCGQSTVLGSAHEACPCKPLKIYYSPVQLRSPAKLSAGPVGHSRRTKRVVIHPNMQGNTCPRTLSVSRLLAWAVCSAPYSLLPETRRNAARRVLASQPLMSIGWQLDAGGFSGSATTWGYRPIS